MRCYCCNVILSDKEACSKLKSGGYAEMCTPCLSSADLEVVIPKAYEEEENDHLTELDFLDDPLEYEDDDD